MKKKLALFLTTAAAAVALSAGAGAPAAVADGSISLNGCCFITYATATYTTSTNKLSIKDNWNGDGYGVRTNYSIDNAFSGTLNNTGGANQTVSIWLSGAGGPNINFNACTKNNSSGVSVACTSYRTSAY